MKPCGLKPQKFKPYISCCPVKSAGTGRNSLILLGSFRTLITPCSSPTALNTLGSERHPKTPAHAP